MKGRELHTIKGVDTIELTECSEHGAGLSYLYNDLLPDVLAAGGQGEIEFCGDRAAVRFTLPDADAFAGRAAQAVAEVICVGYKARFLEKCLRVSLPRRERRLFAAALIAADLEGDAAYVRGKFPKGRSCAVDSLYIFRLGRLREKWEQIAQYIPAGFAPEDLVRFCAYLAGESRNHIYLKGGAVYGADFSRLRRSRLMGEEDAETEIVLSDAGCICCLGEVERSLGDFLQKYYAEHAIFS